MGDLIDSQAAIDALEKMSANYGKKGRREWHPHIEECKSELRMLPSAQPEQHWILCSDGNPIFDGEYLVTFADEDGEWIGTAEWNTTLGGRWQADCFDACYSDVNNVIAWMPLPEPYKEGGEQE